MGKTPKPLRILAFGGIEAWPEIAALQAQGHTIATIHDLRIANVALDSCDLVLGPTAHRMEPGLRKYLKLSIAEARRRKYGAADPATATLSDDGPDA